MEQNIENKNQLLGDLYALRAGMSAISVEKDKLDVSENKYKNVLGNVQKARDEYEKYDYDIQRVQRGLNYCNSQLPRGYSFVQTFGKTKSKGKSSYSKSNRRSKAKANIFEILAYMIIPSIFGIIAAALPWFFYFFTSGSYESDKRMQYSFADSYYRKYIIASAWIFGVIFIFGLIVSIFKVLTNNIGEKKEQKARIKDTEDSIKALKGELSGYLLRKNEAKKGYDKSSAIASQRKAAFEKDKAVLAKLSQAMYERLVAQFKSVLDIRDWKYIDLIIFYFESGRADTLKEALQQVDRRVQTDEIVKEIRIAGQNISATIRMSMNELRGDLNKSFAKLSVQLAEQHREKMVALDGINSNIAKTNESIEKLQIANEKNAESLEKLSSATNLNNALLAKINCDSLTLMSDVDYMIYSAPKASENNTNYTFNVNLK